MTTPTQGLYVDAVPSATEELDCTDELLGQRTWEALLRFRSDPGNFGPIKQTEWPAYRASGLRAIRSFQSEYLRVTVEAFPCALRIEGFVPGANSEGLFVGKWLSNACEFEELGENVRLVDRSARYLSGI